jgi:uncharacterized sulfatase
LAGLAQEAAVPAKPNLVVFITDDESWLERSAYGWSKLPTPHFDRVARDGVLFTHGYTSAPSCAPSRASLLTGRNFWELEQGAFIQAWLPKKFPVLTSLLAAGGYRVGRVGKGWGPGVYPEDGYGQDSAGKPFNRVRVPEPEEKMSPIDYAGSFSAFLDAGPEGKPFFCWVGPTEPHAPYSKKNVAKLDKRYKTSVDSIRVPGFMPDTPGIRRDRANMLYEVCYADEQLGRILAVLEEKGQLDNTLVIVTSDNGTGLPRSKATLYDWGVHEPLAIMWPARVPKGRTVDDFVNFRDFAPTMLEAAGLPIPKTMSGRSLLDMLTSGKSGQVEADRDFMVTGLEWHGEMPPESRAGRMIRDHRYEYIVSYGQMSARKPDPSRVLPDEQFEKTAEQAGWATLLVKHPNHPKVKPFASVLMSPTAAEELYDLEKDPWQLHNVVDDPAYADVKERLKAKLKEYQLATGDPRATGDMKVFDATREFVISRKKAGYKH